MVFIMLGVALVVVKLAGLNPVAEWAWYLVLAPFVLALAWWAWSGKSGHSRRRAMADRGVSAKLRKAHEKAKTARQRQIDKVEGERERKRQANRDSILTTRMDSQFDSRIEALAKAGDTPPRDTADKAGAR